jgi:hypothetical protein
MVDHFNRVIYLTGGLRKNYHGFSMIEFEDFLICGGGRRG